MNSNPLVSFIVPYYNAGDTIQETIDSIFAQTYENFDIWIINDGSTDEMSVQKLSDYDDHSLIHVLHQENSGPGIARNNAIRKTKAEYIVPLDSDDKICEHTLENNLNLLKDNKSIGVVYGNLNYFGGKEYCIEQVSEFEIRKQFLMNQVAVCCLIKKNVFETAGYYDDFLSKPGLEDWEFWIRVFDSGWGFIKADSTFFEIRIDTKSRTYQVANKNLDLIHDYVLKKHIRTFSKEYEKLFYDNKAILETPDYRIGYCLLKPYRLLKKLFYK